MLAVAAAAALAAVLGYFLFFGRISGVFLGIVTLAVTLVLERFMAQTAGPEWHIGAARLNGFNGMSGMPPLTMPWPGGDLVLLARRAALLRRAGAAGRRLSRPAHAGEFALSATCWSRSGRTRSGPTMLGYDVRKYQLGGFVIGSALAGLSGVLYTSLGPIHHAVQHGHHRRGAADRLGRGRRPQRPHRDAGRHAWLVLGGFQALTIYGSQYALVVMGLLLVVTVLLAPEGLFVGAGCRLVCGAACGSRLMALLRNASSTSGSAACR